jgi:phosphotriesterase-related protein
MNRRGFLQKIPAVSAALALSSCAAGIPQGIRREQEVMTVRGRVKAREMGVTLTHEHLLASFQPYEEWEHHPVIYDRNEVIEVVLPYLTQIRKLGCRTFVDATAVGVGRDAVLLRRLSEMSGLHVLTVTGNYAANEYRQLPRNVFTDSPEILARRWIREWHDGIGGTDIRPGFIKLGFNGGPLSEVEQTLIRAGAIAHRETGLTIGAHTGPAIAAFEQLEILEASGIHPSAWIWIHAHVEKDHARHAQAAQRGAWVSFDGVQPESISELVEMVVSLRDQGLLQHVLVSQDAGWYHVGQPRGGTFRPFDTVFTSFIPALRAKGFTQAELDMLFVYNPANAFSIGVRGRGHDQNFALTPSS